MKRLLCLAIPWMVAANAWAQELRPITLQYGHREPITEGVWRRGDDCYLSQENAKKIGWTIRIVDGEADIEAEGRRVRVPVRSDLPGSPISLIPALGQLGAYSEWGEDDDLRVLGMVRSIGFENGRLSIDSTLAFAPSLFKLANPSRMVVDLHGAKLPEGNGFTLPPSIRAGQYNRSVVRIVVEHPSVEELYLPGVSSGRKLDLAIGFLGTKDPDGTDSIGIPQPLPLENTTETVERKVDYGPPPPPPIFAVKASCESLSEWIDVVTIVHSGKIGTPKASYDSPLAIAIEIPGTKLAAELPQISKSNAIAGMSWTSSTAGNAVLTLQLSRAHGYSVKGTGNKLIVQLLRPKTGDGQLSGKTIVLDAGHGGDDGGAQWAAEGVQEKNCTLKVVKVLQAQLQAEGANVILTRFDDTRIPLTERPAIAARAKADVFISVHFNSNKNANSTSGIISFYHGQDPISRLLAECIQTELGAMGHLPKIGTWSDTRIYSSGFAVLRNAKMPATLLELGFINHKKDRQKIVSPEFHSDAAAAIIRGLKVYFANGNS